MLLMQGMFTGLLGNLSLLSYFTKKREKEVIVVQTLGAVSQYVVFLQLAMAEAMPLPYLLCDYFSCCRSRAYIEFHELF